MYMFSFESNNLFQFFCGVVGFWVFLEACACSKKEVTKIKQDDDVSNRLLLNLFGRGCLFLKNHPLIKLAVVLFLAYKMAMVV